MRSNKYLIFNEKEEAEKIIKNGFENKKINYGKMHIIAKYLKQELGYGQKRLEAELVSFCQKVDKNFNPVVESELIKKWVNSGMLYTLKQIQKITITEKEINFLKTIDNPIDKKILFVTLVIAKSLKTHKVFTKKETKKTDNFYIRYNNIGDIIFYSKLRIKETEIADIFYKYKEYFGIYPAKYQLIKINFATDASSIGFTIEKPENMLNYYELFFGKTKIISICDTCGKEIIKTNNNQKRCFQCSKDIRKEQTRQRVQRHRKKLWENITMK